MHFCIKFTLCWTHFDNLCNGTACYDILTFVLVKFDKWFKFFVALRDVKYVATKLVIDGLYSGTLLKILRPSSNLFLRNRSRKKRRFTVQKWFLSVSFLSLRLDKFQSYFQTIQKDIRHCWRFATESRFSIDLECFNVSQ